jgi:hypothetical protein
MSTGAHIYSASHCSFNLEAATLGLLLPVCVSSFAIGLYDVQQVTGRERSPLQRDAWVVCSDKYLNTYVKYIPKTSRPTLGATLEYSGRSLNLNTPSHLLLKLGMRGAITPLMVPTEQLCLCLTCKLHDKDQQN